MRHPHFRNPYFCGDFAAVDKPIELRNVQSDRGNNDDRNHYELAAD